MLNIGMTELLCFAIIALLVLGPEKLPEGARFAAKWYGKFKRLISSVQNEVDRELRLSEFRAEVQKEIERMTELERRMQQQIDALRSPPSEPAQQTFSTASHNHYQPLGTPALFPYSCSHIQQNLPHLLNMQESQLSPVKLKIAV